MADRRIVLLDGSEIKVRGYAIEGERLRLRPVAGEAFDAALVDVDLRRTFAANASDDDGGGEEAAADLDLVRLSEQIRGDCLLVEGLVRNLSGRDLRNVVATVLARDEAGDFVTVEEALIAWSPLRSGAESPFRVVLRSRARVARTEIRFRDLLGPALALRRVAEGGASQR